MPDTLVPTLPAVTLDEAVSWLAARADAALERAADYDDDVIVLNERADEGVDGVGLSTTYRDLAVQKQERAKHDRYAAACAKRLIEELRK